MDDAYNKYRSEALDRPTTAPPYKPTTFVRYIAPRTIGLNPSKDFQGSLRHFSMSNLESNYVLPKMTTSFGLASLVQSSLILTNPTMHSINGEHINDEYHELSKLNETLNDTVLRSYQLDVHNRAQELQIELLETNANRNSLTIKKMFQAEMETARKLIDDASRYKTDLKKKLDDTHQTTLTCDEQYQQLLSKRNSKNKELFDYQHKLAQNRAEAEFLRSRIQHFNEEINFYTLKNNLLQARQVKLSHELDEEIYAKQVLECECETLKSEKITTQDIHAASIDNIQETVNINDIPAFQPSQYFHEQLTYELRRMQSEYEKKIQTYRDELHRKCELELHRYQMHKLRPVPNVTREHEQNLEQYEHKKKDVERQLEPVRENIYKIQFQIEMLEKRIIDERIDTESASKSQRHLEMLEQIIHEREKQLNEAIRIRATFKQQIENYQKQVNRYLPQIKHSSIETEQSTLSKMQEITNENDQQSQSSSNIIQPISLPLQPKSSYIGETPFESTTVTRIDNFNVDQGLI